MTCHKKVFIKTYSLTLTLSRLADDEARKKLIYEKINHFHVLYLLLLLLLMMKSFHLFSTTRIKNEKNLKMCEKNKLIQAGNERMFIKIISQSQLNVFNPCKSPDFLLLTSVCVFGA
jgi:hypothetical protein